MSNQEITYAPVSITFDAFGTYMKKAKEVAAYIDSIILTEENVGEAKKTLADARKLTTALEDQRKAIKREVMAPYKEFEDQVKEIVGVIDAADTSLRSQVRQMEERQRDEKEENLRQIWERRVSHYGFPQYVPDSFDRWLTPQHLNKSTSTRSCEDSMSEFMERVERDTAAIMKMPDAEDIMAQYAKSLDMTDALVAVQREKEYKAKAFAKSEPAADTATFVITGKASITLAEKLFAENGIEYRRI